MFKTLLAVAAFLALSLQLNAQHPATMTGDVSGNTYEITNDPLPKVVVTDPSGAVLLSEFVSFFSVGEGEEQVWFYSSVGGFNATYDPGNGSSWDVTLGSDTETATEA